MSQSYFEVMINVTDNAVRQLRNLLSQRPEESGRGLRVQVGKGGCSGLHYELTLAQCTDGDAIVECDAGHFFIDEGSVPNLPCRALDFTDCLTRHGFRSVN